MSAPRNQTNKVILIGSAEATLASVLCSGRCSGATLASGGALERDRLRLRERERDLGRPEGEMRTGGGRAGDSRIRRLGRQIRAWAGSGP